MHQITVIPGDGIGPEVVQAAIRVVEATGAPIEWEYCDAGLSALEKVGEVLPQKTISSIERNRVALKGPTSTPIGTGHHSVNVALRARFKLFANIRPVRSWAGIKTRFDNVDIVLFREGLEDAYIGEERLVDAAQTIAEATSRITEEGSERIARYAFDYARTRERGKITVVHKANILKLTHGLFLKTVQRVAREYPEIECMDMIADNFMAQLVHNHAQFDCVVLPNFLGDLASDLAAELAGGLGVAPGANIGTDYSIFEAVHGTAPLIAGKGIANPAAMILSAVLMLDHLCEYDAALRIANAVGRVFSEGRWVTADLKQNSGVSTEDFIHAVIRKL